MPTAAGELRGADAVLVVAPDQHDLLGAVGDPRQLRAEPRLHGRDRHRLRAGAPRRTGARCARRPPAPRPRCFCSTWRGVSGCASTPSRSSGPRLMSTTAWKFGGWGGSDAVARSTKRSSSSSRSRSLCRRSNPIVEETFMSMPGPPAQGAAEVPGPDLDAVGRAAAAARAASGRSPRAPSSLSTARSGRAMSPTNRVSPVSTAHGSRAARRVDQARTPCARAGGRACACARTHTAPSASSQPSSNGSWS